MSKMIRLSMGDGSKWDLPAEFVAESAALSFSEDRESLEYKNEFEWRMGNKDGLLDWIQNNMNWSDFHRSLKRVAPPSPPDYEELYKECEIAVVELD